MSVWPIGPPTAAGERVKVANYEVRTTQIVKTDCAELEFLKSLWGLGTEEE